MFVVWRYLPGGWDGFEAAAVGQNGLGEVGRRVDFRAVAVLQVGGWHGEKNETSICGARLKGRVKGKKEGGKRVRRKR